ncbi:hypothetical protein FDECE_13957 [Fusarium decemcellulare]|nr:hypothetical protein FDECE_13957 [Fusarium decemcellulare]
MEGQLVQMATTTDSAGIKRGRSGRPKSRFQGQMEMDCPDYLTSSSEDESISGSSESGSDSDEDTYSHDECISTQEFTLPKDHGFQSLRADLLESLHTKFESWAAAVKYAAPPDDRLPPRKRYRASSWETQFPTSEKNEQPGEKNNDFVIVSQARGFFHLACPFFVSDPKYRGCLLKDDLQSIEQVISHLGRHHMQPFYCPRCSETFDDVISRDDHILDRKCDLLPLQKIEGINPKQRAKLVRRDKVYWGEAKRWRRIWKTVFPNTVFPDSEQSCFPYLSKGYGLSISMARDYFGMYGHSGVSEFLDSRRVIDEDQGEDVRARHVLCRLALEDLVELLSEEQECGEPK